MKLICAGYEEAIAKCNELMKDGFFEFSFSYVPTEEKFRELDRFIWESKHQCARFKNYYEGDAVIELTEWNDNFTNEYFDAFMFYLKGNLGRISTTFIVDGRCSEALEKKMEKFFSIEIVELDENRANEEDGRFIGFAAGTEVR